MNELAKFRYRSGGEYPAPVVIRTPVGGGISGGHYHSQSPEALFIHTPGLKVVCPSNPYDAKGLLASAIRGDDPVIFMEPKRIYRAAEGEVPEGEYTIPLGEAKVVREGTAGHACSPGARWCTTALEAAEKGAGAASICEVIDLRTLMPFDIDTILDVGEEDRPRGDRARGAARPAASAPSWPRRSRSRRSCTWRRRSCASPGSTRRSRTRSSTSTCPTPTASSTRSSAVG